MAWLCVLLCTRECVICLSKRNIISGISTQFTAVFWLPSREALRNTLNCKHVKKWEVLLICVWFGLHLSAVFGQCFDSTFKKGSSSYLLGVRQNRENPYYEANVSCPGQPHRELVGVELGWQKELQWQKEENDEKIQGVTGGQGESGEGDGVMNSHLLPDSTSVLCRSHCRCFTQQWWCLICARAIGRQQNVLEGDQLVLRLTLSESCHRAAVGFARLALSIRCWKIYLFPL